MSDQTDHRQPARRVVLPSGKTIEVVYFSGDRTAQGSVRRAGPETGELHVCGSCSGELVYPVEWTEAGTTHWEVTLRCPECEETTTGVFAQGAVERFDEQLDRGTDAVLRDLKRLMQANMEEAIDRFSAALHEDHILPSDF